MNQRLLIARVARALLFAAVILLTANGSSSAQQSDIDSIKGAIEAFHAALGTLDVSKMDPLWAHDAGVILINPRDKAISIGWDAVRKNWEATFNNYSALKVTQTDGPHVRVNGDMAWSAGTALAALTPRTGAAVNAPTFEADVFQRSGGQWLLVSHAAWRIPK
jgi:ketosteroid isomerase-like protein